MKLHRVTDPTGRGAHRLMTANVLAVYSQASEEERGAGADWYEIASREAEILAFRYGVTYGQAVGVIATLSPQCGWVENLRRAERMLATGRSRGGTRNQDRKARAILSGEVWWRIGCADYGPKVWSFADNIADPTRSDEVTIDRHAVGIALGAVLNERQVKILERVGRYEAVAAAYREAAGTVGILPHQVQATCWVWWTGIAEKAASRRRALATLAAAPA